MIKNLSIYVLLIVVLVGLYAQEPIDLVGVMPSDVDQATEQNQNVKDPFIVLKTEVEARRKLEDYFVILEIVSDYEREYIVEEREVKASLAYWKGLALTKRMEYEKGLKFYQEALSHFAFKWHQDIYFTYGEALYENLDTERAREAFRQSLKIGYEKARSLYFMGLMSEELGALKSAVRSYAAVSRVAENNPEDRITMQAAELKIADLIYTQVQSKRHSIDAIEEHVLPQYEKALYIDDESALSQEIKEKIKKILKRYDLFLFNLRTGRPTVQPRYFLKAAIAAGSNNNVNLLPESTLENTENEDKVANYYNFNTVGRYTFYLNDSMSVAPQFMFNRSEFLSNSENVKINNSQLFLGTLQFTYDHFYKKSPAIFFIDVNYGRTQILNTENDQYKNFQTDLGLTFTEQLELFSTPDSFLRSTFFRFRYNNGANETPSLNSTTLALNFEQMAAYKSTLFYFTSSLSQLTYESNENSALNNLALSLRFDTIFPVLFYKIAPTFFLALTESQFPDASDNRRHTMTSFGINLNRKLSRRWFLFFDYTINQRTGNLDRDNFDQQTYSFSFDYIY